MNNKLRDTVLIFSLLLIFTHVYGENSDSCDADIIKKTINGKLKKIKYYKTDVAVKFEGFEIETRVVGKKPKNLKISQKIITPKGPINYLTVFDGSIQWVETKKDDYIHVVKLNLSDLTAPERPFDTGYYLMGTGLMNGEDYASTFKYLLDFYILTAKCENSSIVLSGWLNDGKFKNYVIKIKKLNKHEKYMKIYKKKFSFASFDVDKNEMK